MFINISFEQPGTTKSELLDAIQFLADIINNTGCQGYIESMAEKLEECCIDFTFGDEIGENDEN